MTFQKYHAGRYTLEYKIWICLNTLKDHPNIPYTEVARFSNTSHSVIKSIIPEIIKRKFVTGKKGKYQIYLYTITQSGLNFLKKNKN